MDRERYIENVIAQLKGELTRAGIVAEVTGRPKHIFSIYKKMKRKGVTFESLYDVRAVRVLVTGCEGLLRRAGAGAQPVDADSRGVRRLHRQAQEQPLPIAAHRGDRARKTRRSRCRSAPTRCTSTPSSAWRRTGATRKARAAIGATTRRSPGCARSSNGRTSSAMPASWPSSSAPGCFDDTIYVLTPQGRVIDLPKGSTPMDFAYHVHTELGHRCRGAKVDGAMVPLNTAARERPAGRNPGREAGRTEPRLAQSGTRLRKKHGARAKIRQWFNRQNLETAMAQGRALVEQGAAAAGHDRAQPRQARGAARVR